MLSEAGALLTVQSKPGGSSGFGGAATVIDAVPYRKKRVRLSGIIKVTEGITTVDEVLRNTPQWDR